MLKRSHNEVINIFMNKINHTLAQQCVHLKAKCTSAAPCLHPRTLGGALGSQQARSPQGPENNGGH